MSTGRDLRLVLIFLTTHKACRVQAFFISGRHMSQSQKPRMQWLDMRDQIAKDAKTMSNAEMAKKYGVAKYVMRAALSRLGITPVSMVVDWSEKLDDVKQRAPTMTAQQLADHYSVTILTMYGVLSRYKINAVHQERAPRFSGGTEELAKMAPMMTEKELADHFRITALTVRKHLKRMGIQCKQLESEGLWQSRLKEVVTKVDQGCTTDELAQHFGCTVTALRNGLYRVGLKLKTAKRPRPKRAKKEAPKASTANPSATTPQPTKRAPEKRKAPQIVTPENVKVTRAPFSPPPNSRICNGSSTTPYNPAIHGGATTSYR